MNVPIHGRQGINRYYQESAHYTQINIQSLPGDLTIKRAVFWFDGLRDRFTCDYETYFRTVYNVLAFIDNSNIDDKQVYPKLFRGKLSKQEVLMIYYGCLTEDGIETLKPLVERHSLIKYIEDEKLFNPRDRELFEESAFA